MAERQQKALRLLASASLISIIVLVSVTSPADKIGYTMIFFLLMLVFLISAGYLLIGRLRGSVSPKNRYRLFIVCISVVILLMFRSAQSLGWIDGLVLALVAGGLLFYSSRRA